MTAQFLMGLIGFGGGVVAASGAAALVIGLGIIPGTRESAGLRGGSCGMKTVPCWESCWEI